MLLRVAFTGLFTKYFQFSLQKYEGISFPYPLEVRCYHVTFWVQHVPLLESLSVSTTCRVLLLSWQL